MDSLKLEHMDDFIDITSIGHDICLSNFDVRCNAGELVALGSWCMMRSDGLLCLRTSNTCHGTRHHHWIFCRFAPNLGRLCLGIFKFPMPWMASPPDGPAPTGAFWENNNNKNNMQKMLNATGRCRARY